MIQVEKVSFVDSVFSLAQLPVGDLPEIAFAGRSNVGKSSLLNCLLRRKNLVKVSARPGKTQSLNFYLVGDQLHLVDLPGYGFARVDKRLQAKWQELITAYLETRPNLRCVVLIIDLRHALKESDRMLAGWLQAQGIPWLPVYTKKDKLSRNQQQRQARLLDAALGVSPKDRLLFSSLSGEGRQELLERLETYLMSTCQGE
ncbi:ribosome biogenesis GTP-binding protein YihA/YsxC [Desulfurivibrio alkaliphilus]|uniref:Probable GTP-binding protein EngB n=1 Tax=Desulfurivibrio alkaliphilus (strain DSM 19089 / UNIQEM U267 / AHT2) TaxID=589865 RepID=D6Z3C4_DESAT|nr:ribosome biogenesis GTP-binding protein YihA/YsxC [Desulfurivibrio alkaliphilus]ADH86049.1 ribosome biogenesis GTP-binding protein YsxC [Desulfurivibrio alkaliphilus AHT 2]